MATCSRKLARGVHKTGSITKLLLFIVLHKCVWCDKVAAVARIVR